MSRLLFAVVTAIALVALPLSHDALAAPDTVRLARTYVAVGADGMFVINPTTPQAAAAQLHHVFDPLNGKLASIDRSLRPTIGRQTPASRSTASAGGKLAAPLASFCGYVPRWAFEAFAWYVIIVGGVMATVSLFVDATILGLPAGAVLGAAGIWTGMTGSALLWYVDTYMPPQGVYECIF